MAAMLAKHRDDGQYESGKCTWAHAHEAEHGDVGGDDAERSARLELIRRSLFTVYKMYSIHCFQKVNKFAKFLLKSEYT